MSMYLGDSGPVSWRWVAVVKDRKCWAAYTVQDGHFQRGCVTDLTRHMLDWMLVLRETRKAEVVSRFVNRVPGPEVAGWRSLARNLPPKQFCHLETFF